MPRETFEYDVTELGHAVGQLIRRVRAAADGHDLSWTESSVMNRLAKEGPATTAELARNQGVRPQSMGATIATLEERGIVERQPHPTDGRQMNVALTETGAELQKTMKAAKWNWLIQAVEKLSEEDQTTLFAATEIIKRMVDL